jgi:hypothetical protein
MDQVIAQRIGHLTPLPSLELGLEPPATGVDTNVGYTQLYGAHISWGTPTTPLTKELNPKAVFDRLFRKRQSRSRSPGSEGRSVIDAVLEEAKVSPGEAWPDDRQKLDEYFEVGARGRKAH